MTRLPHARGGVSKYGTTVAENPLSSPRPWGCFWRWIESHPFRGVFPTPVGVFLPPDPHGWQLHRLPHARGGVSLAKIGANSADGSSPRPWGCFHDVSVGVNARTFHGCYIPKTTNQQFL